MGWGGFLDKLLSKLPIQDRKERWKNQIDNLNKEQKELLKGEPRLAKSKKYNDNKLAIDKLNQLLKNASS